MVDGQAAVAPFWTSTAARAHDERTGLGRNWSRCSPNYTVLSAATTRWYLKQKMVAKGQAGASGR